MKMTKEQAKEQLLTHCETIVDDYIVACWEAIPDEDKIVEDFDSWLRG